MYYLHINFLSSQRNSNICIMYKPEICLQVRKVALIPSKLLGVGSNKLGTIDHLPKMSVKRGFVIS